MTKIQIDTREPPTTFAAFCKQTELEVEEKFLEVGDIQFGSIIIERKTINDFLRSIRKALFWKKFNVMKNEYKLAILYLEGSEEDVLKAVDRTKFSWSSMRGAMMALELQGIHINRFPTIKYGVDYFTKLFVKSEIKTRQKSPPTIRKVNTDVDVLRRAAVAQVPKVGFKKAEDILGTQTIYKMIGLLMNKKHKSKVEDNIVNFFCNRDL